MNFDTEKQKKPKTNGTFCELCSVYIPNKTSLKAHLIGQKHTKNLSKQEEWRKKAISSLYVGGIKHLPVAELALADYFSFFCNVKKVTIDKTSKYYAIVELEDPNVVKELLEQKHHIVNGVTVAVKSRELKSAAASKTKKQNQNVKEDVLDKDIFNALLQARDVCHQVTLLQEELQLTAEDISLRELLCKLIQTALQEAFPGCSIEPFGSSSSGFGVKGCDLDLHFQFDKVHPDVLHDILSQEEDMENSQGTSPKNESPSNELILLAVAEIIKQCVPDCHKIKTILTARLPVVRFHHKSSKMKCDISLANRIAVQNTAYLRFCCQLQPSFKPLVFAARTWMKHWELAGGLNSNGPRLNNYAVTLMVLFYMQYSGQIPSLQDMRSAMTGPKTIINGWDCSFPSPQEASVIRSKFTCPSRALGENFAHFLEFYSSVGFVKTVLALSLAKILPISNLAKKAVTNLSNDSSCFSDTIENRNDVGGNANETRSGPFKVGPLNIRDPFELFHNVAGNVNEKHMKVFIRCIRNGFLASKMKAFRLKSPSGGAWGFLNLLVDHHHKNEAKDNKESVKSNLDHVILIKNSARDNTCSVASSLVLTVLQDVFLITIENHNELSRSGKEDASPIPENHSESEITAPLKATPCLPASKSIETSSNSSSATSRKRAASPEPCNYCKRAKTIFSSPTAERVSLVHAEDIRLPYTVKCTASHMLWQGRRKARRTILQKGKSDLYELEKQVSKLLLCDQGDCSSRNSSMEINAASEELDTSTSSGSSVPASKFSFLLTLECVDDTSLLLKFRSDSINSDFMTFYHHLNGFLPDFILKCMRQ